MVRYLPCLQTNTKYLQQMELQAVKAEGSVLNHQLVSFLESATLYTC